jgi:hypothetical protein
MLKKFNELPLMKSLQNCNQLLYGFTQACKDLARELYDHQYRKYTPNLPLNDDVYLVSYPKSGSTWMSFLIANSNIGMSNDNRFVTLYNIHQYVPDIHLSRQIGKPLLSFPGFRFIKSHSRLNNFYNNVIYIVRHPEDTMVSYYNFLFGLGQFNGTLSDLIRSKQYGISSWCNHVGNWLNNSSVSQSFMLVKYEDLKINSARELNLVYRNLGFTLPQIVLDNAVNLSSFSNMQKLEQDQKWGRKTFRNFNFIRKGQMGEGKTFLSDEDKLIILKNAGHLMEEFGYL